MFANIYEMAIYIIKQQEIKPRNVSIFQIVRLTYGKISIFFGIVGLFGLILNIYILSNMVNLSLVWIARSVFGIIFCLVILIFLLWAPYIWMQSISNGEIITAKLVEIEKMVKRNNGNHMMTGYIEIFINGVITRRRIIAQGPWIKDVNKGAELKILVYPSANPKTMIRAYAL